MKKIKLNSMYGVFGGNNFEDTIDSFNYLIRNLSLKEKEVIIQKVLLKATLSEIAQTMRKPLGSISSIYYRAQDKIKEDLEKDKKN